MGITKKQRQDIFNKSGGLCWYCGDPLQKRWHVDHIDPIFRDKNGMPRKIDLDKYENMVPACPSCNLFKSVFDLESFRSEIEAQKERVRRYSSGFRIAEKMGIIQIVDKPVVFWFEENIKN